MGNTYTPHIDVTPETKKRFTKLVFKKSDAEGYEVKQEDMIKELLDDYIRHHKRYRG